MAPYAYDPASPIPARGSDAALQLLAEAREDAVDAVEAAVDSLDSTFATLWGQGPPDPRALARTLPVVTDVLARRAVYFARAVRLRELLDLPESSLPPPPVSPTVLQAMACSETSRPEDCQDSLRRMITTAQAALGAANRTLEEWTHTVASDGHYATLRPDPRSNEYDEFVEFVNARRGPGDRIVVEPRDLLTRLIQSQKKLRASREWVQDVALAKNQEFLDASVEPAEHLATLERAMAEVTAVTAAAVSRAIEAAGDVPAVIEGVTAALALEDREREQSPAAHAAEEQLTQAEAAVAALKAAGINKEAAAMLEAVASVKTAEKALHALARRATAERRAIAQQLVDDSLAGEEKARATLEHHATKHPTAFAPGLAAALGQARIDRCAVGSNPTAATAAA
jgi:hypothetical protein